MRATVPQSAVIIHGTGDAPSYGMVRTWKWRRLGAPQRERGGGGDGSEVPLSLWRVYSKGGGRNVREKLTTPSSLVVSDLALFGARSVSA